MSAVTHRRAAWTTARGPWRRLAHRGLGVEGWIAVGIVVVVLLITVGVVLFPTQVSFTSLMLPLLVGSIFLGPRTLPWIVIFLLLMLTIAVSQQVEVSSRTIFATLVMFTMAFIVLATSLRRSRLGVAGARGESMFIDLRDRILTQGGIPALPAGWTVESALHSAGGTPFAGDFVVASRSPAGDRLDVVVVDVSGKGEEAGTRALLLSGAMGGLLGALPPDRFLTAANEYLLRQDWDEGFATAVHLSLDLGGGTYEIRGAGHPPPVQRAAGSGRWSVLRTDGPVLGIIEGATFACVRGRIERGDALLLYTDGMVEEPRRDIDLGIDRMLGEAESLLRGSYQGAASLLAESLGSPADDRAVMVVHRH